MWRVSSQATMSARSKASRARAERSERLPIGVDTTRMRPAGSTGHPPTYLNTETLRAGASWTATPRLTFEGVRIFGDVYQVGAELAPLFVEPEEL